MTPNNYTPISIQALTSTTPPPIEKDGIQAMFEAKGTRLPETTSEPAMISSAQGAKVVQDTQARLDAIAPPPPETGDITEQKTTSPEPVTTTETPKVEVSQDFVTYVDPETGAETTLRGDAITDKAKAELERKGMIMSASDTSRGDLKAADLKRKQAEAELNNTISELSRTAINSKELQRTIKSIQATYNSRIAVQQEMNRRREQTLNTLGVRLGSRYTGDTFAGIVAEEERQGIARITEIEAEMQRAVEGAKKAAKEHNYSVFVKMTELAEKKAEEKTKAFEDLQKKQKEAQAAIEEEAKLIENQSSIIEEIQKGTTDPFEIFTALGGLVPFDMIKELTDTLPEDQKPITLGSADLLVDPKTGKVIARGSKVGGAGVETDISGGTSYGAPVVSVGAPIIAGLGSSYSTSSSEAQMLIDDILNKIPVQLRNTEKETALKIEQIRKQLAAGYSYQDIVDRLSGFSLQGDKADKSVGSALYNLALGTDITGGDLASLLNRGATEQAMTTVENAQLQKVNAFFANTDKARGSVKQADQVLSILNDPLFPKDKLGAFDGRKFKVERFAGLTPQEVLKVQQLESALSLLNAPIRLEVAGTAATPSEMEKITGFQADILDQPEIVKSKVQDLRDSVLRFHNEARSQRGLPQVSTTQLLDNKKRVDLYRSIGNADQEIANSQLNTGDFLSSGSWNGSTPAVDTSKTDNKSFFDNLTK